MNNVKSAEAFASKIYDKWAATGEKSLAELVQERDAEVWRAACEHCAGIVGRSNTTNLLALRQQLLAAKNDMPKQQTKEGSGE